MDAAALVERTEIDAPNEPKAEWKGRVAVARSRLRRRPRPTKLSHKTSQELDNPLPKAYDPCDRTAFYAAAQEAMAAARTHHERSLARRLAERRAVLRVLALNGLESVDRWGVRIDSDKWGHSCE